jgi:hypothetical protein
VGTCRLRQSNVFPEPPCATVWQQTHASSHSRPQQHGRCTQPSIMRQLQELPQAACPLCLCVLLIAAALPPCHPAAPSQCCASGEGPQVSPAQASGCGRCRQHSAQTRPAGGHKQRTLTPLSLKASAAPSAGLDLCACVHFCCMMHQELPALSLPPSACNIMPSQLQQLCTCQRISAPASPLVCC